MSLDCTKNWLLWRESQHPQCFPQWVWGWNSLGFPGWEHCLCQQTPPGRVTPSIFSRNVPELKMHSWDKLNISVKEVVWIGCFLGGKWHTHTVHYAPRCCIRWAPNKEIKTYIFFQKSHLLWKELTLVKRKSAHIVFSWVILRVKHFGIYRVRILFVPVDWNWQIHSQHISLQCPSTENAHSG